VGALPSLLSSPLSLPSLPFPPLLSPPLIQAWFCQRYSGLGKCPESGNKFGSEVEEIQLS